MHNGYGCVVDNWVPTIIIISQEENIFKEHSEYIPMFVFYVEISYMFVFNKRTALNDYKRTIDNQSILVSIFFRRKNPETF